MHWEYPWWMKVILAPWSLYEEAKHKLKKNPSEKKEESEESSPPEPPKTEGGA